jgi:hypothetical protein
MKNKSKCVTRPEIEWSKIDAGIRDELRVLVESGVATFESCQGGQGHPFPEPTIRFFGQRAEGFRALGIALQSGLRVTELRRYWSIEDREPVGPHWEMIFRTKGGGGAVSVPKKNGTVSWKWV